MAPIQSNIQTGIVTGIGSGLDWWPYSSGPSLLANLDFSTPATSWKTGRTGFSSAYATDEWLFQNHTTGAYANNVGSATLDNTSGGLTDQIAVGVWDGSSYVTRLAWEGLETGGSRLVCSDATVGNPGGSDICVRVVLRVLKHAASDAIVSKRDATTGTPGWSITLSSGGIPVLAVNDGTNSASFNLSTTVSDGAWHYITFWFDESTGNVFLKSDVDAEATQASSVTSPTATNTLSVNALFPTHTSSGCAQQIAYVGLCIGANAQAMYEEEFWNHASDPTGLLTTQTRASLISVPVADGYVGHFTHDALTIGYHSGFTNSSKLGLYCNSAVTNVVPYSEDITQGWSNVNNSTDTGNFADAPDGFRSAGKLTAVDANGYIVDNTTTITAAAYTYSIWVKRSGASDVSGKLRFLDIGGATGFDDQAFTATSTWQRIYLTHTFDASSTAGQFSVWVNTAGESILVWGAQVELGSEAGAYIRTSGAAASLSASVYSAVGAFPTVNALGEIKCTSITSKQTAATAQLWAVPVAAGAAAVANRKFVYTSGANFVARLGDSTGALEDNFTIAQPALGAEAISRYIWDQSTDGEKTGGREIVFVLNGVTTNGAASPWEDGNVGDGAAPQDIALGHTNSVSQYNCIIQSIQLYDDLSEALPQ